MSFLPEITHFWYFWILLGCLEPSDQSIVDTRNENHPGRWFLRVQKAGTNWTKVTGSLRELSPKIKVSVASQAPFFKTFPAKDSVTQGFHLGALSCPNGLDFKRLLPFERESRAERGDSAYSPNVQRHTSARLHLQAGMRKQALNALRSTQSVLNRDSKLIGGGVLRSVQRGSRCGETRI